MYENRYGAPECCMAKEETFYQLSRSSAYLKIAPLPFTSCYSLTLSPLFRCTPRTLNKIDAALLLPNTLTKVDRFC